MGFFVAGNAVGHHLIDPAITAVHQGLIEGLAQFCTQCIAAGANLLLFFFAEKTQGTGILFQRGYRQQVMIELLMTAAAGQFRQITDGLFDGGRVGERPHWTHRLGPQISQHILQHAQPFAFAGNDRHDRAAEPARQFIGIDVHTVLVGHVSHVQRHHHRQRRIQQLGGQVQIAFEAGGIDDIQHHIRVAGKNEFLRDLFVEGGVIGSHVQGIGAGQINQFVVEATVMEHAGFFFHGDARPVAHPLARTCQGVEQGGLAAIGIAHQGDSVGRVHTSSTCRPAASSRRRDR